MTSAQAERPTGTVRVSTFESRAMGSGLRLTITGVPMRTAERAWDAVGADITRTEAVLSRFRDDSDLTRLNRGAGSEPMEVDFRLYVLLATSARAQRLTEGRFDPRILGRLEALGEHGAALPALDRVTPPPNEAWLAREPRSRHAAISRPIDSGGLGKGLGLRWAMRVAVAAVPEAAGILIEAGGDVVARGHGPDTTWRIGIEDPIDPGRDPLAVIELGDAAVATSSTAVRRWISADGDAVHHLIDPRTGDPGGDGLLAVTVRHRDPAWAEVWSKALFLGGPGLIGPEARARGMAAWWVEADGSLHMTPVARTSTTWTRTEGLL